MVACDNTNHLISGIDRLVPVKVVVMVGIVVLTVVLVEVVVDDSSSR